MGSYGQAQKQVKTHNFDQTLPEAHANYANEVFKSTYNLGFLGVTEPVKELELENRLIAKIRSFIMELGRGFSFIGNQYRLEYNGKEYFVDCFSFTGLLFLIYLYRYDLHKG
jgi:predicted nuclease of restriction endonuclease-like (RecB) superfamily